MNDLILLAIVAVGGIYIWKMISTNQIQLKSSAQENIANKQEQEPAPAKPQLRPRLVIEQTTAMTPSAEVTQGWLSSHGIQAQSVYDLAMCNVQGPIDNLPSKVKGLVDMIWQSGQGTGTELRDFIFNKREISKAERLWFVLVESKGRPTVRAFIGKNVSSS